MTGSSKVCVAGFGMRPDAGLVSLRVALALTGAQGRPLAALATLAERAEVLRPLAIEMGLPLHIVSVAGVQTPTQSDRVQALFGTGSVAEAAALTAAGPAATLVVLRVTSGDGMATCALAEGDAI